jgi:hypothetical protein
VVRNGQSLCPAKSDAFDVILAETVENGSLGCEVFLNFNLFSTNQSADLVLLWHRCAAHSLLNEERCQLPTSLIGERVFI